MRGNPPEGDGYASLPQVLGQCGAFPEGIGWELPVEGGDDAQVGLCVGEDGYVRDGGLSLASRLRVGVGVDQVEGDAQGGFDGEGLAVGFPAVEGVGDGEAVFLPGTSCQFLLPWVGKSRECIPTLGVPLPVVMAVHDTNPCVFAVSSFVRRDAVVRVPAPVGPEDEVMRPKLGVPRAIRRGEERRGYPPVQVGSLMLLEHDFSAELGNLGRWFASALCFSRRLISALTLSVPRGGRRF